MPPIIVIVLVAWLSHGLLAGDGFSGMDDAVAAAHSHRPLLEFTYALNRRYGHWADTNMVIHMLACLLVFAIARRLGAGRPAATLSGCLLAAHPMAADAVQSVAGRSSELCALLMLASIYLAIQDRIAWSVAVGALAVLAKEEALALLLVILMIDWALRREGRLAVASIALAALALPFYLRATEGAGAVPQLVLAGLERAPALDVHAARYVSAMGSYAWPNMVMPLHLSADPDIAFSRGYFVGGALVLIALAAVALTSRKKTLAIGCAVALGSLLAYLPASLPDVFFEHRAYLALAGVALMATAMFDWKTLAVAVALFAFLSMDRSIVYASPRALWADAMSKSHRPRPVINHAEVLLSEGDNANAWRELYSIRDNPFARHALANMRLSHGDFAGASRILDGEGF